MERLWVALVLASLLLTACYALPTALRPGSGLAPVYRAEPSPVLRYRREAGFVVPGEPQTTTVELLGSGSWTATRSVAADGGAIPAATASGTLTAAQVQQLVDAAFAPPDLWTPPFVELASSSVFPIKGQSASTLTLTLRGGQHEVQVVGTRPAAFWKLEQALAGATGLTWSELLQE